jgi:hypothetical protein
MSAGLPAMVIRRVVVIGFWSPCLAFARRAKEAGVAVHLIDLAEEPIEFDRHSAAIEPEGEVLLWRDIKTPKGLQQILKFVKSVGADAILTADEHTQLWIAENREQFGPECRVLSPPAETLEILLKKQEQIEIARQAGFHLLPSWELHAHGEESKIPAESFPVCLRPGEPASATPMFKAMVLDRPEDLKDFLDGITWRGALLAQPYLMGPNIVVHGVCGEEGEMQALRAFLAYRKSRGFAVSLRSYRLPVDVREACVQFAKLSKIQGPFHYDLLQSAHTRKIYFLEVNVRMGGTTAKVMRMGYDEPLLLLNSFGMQTPLQVPQLARDESNVTGKRLAFAHLMDVLRQRKDPLSYPHRSWLLDVLSAVWETIIVPDVHVTWHDVRGSLWYLLRLNRASKPKALNH